MTDEPDITPRRHDAPSDAGERLLFRATHRGTFENDLMIGGFVRAHLASLTDAELDALEAVMELPDPVLADWLTGRVPIPAEEETPMLRRCAIFCRTDAMSTRDRVRGGRRCAKVWGAPEGWDAFLLAQRRREHSGSVLHVARDDARMARLAEALAFVMPEAEVLRFPAWDCLPYDRVSPNPALVSERVATLARLLEKPTGPRIVLTTVNALVQRVPPRSAFTGASMELTVNGQVKPEKLAGFLEANGYGRAGR